MPKFTYFPPNHNNNKNNKNNNNNNNNNNKLNILRDLCKCWKLGLYFLYMCLGEVYQPLYAKQWRSTSSQTLRQPEEDLSLHTSNGINNDLKGDETPKKYSREKKRMAYLHQRIKENC
ncbi:hypothetical protein ElyMa_001621800 [Elysia marginata]|uniref:Uncharacterized protein n=1 Tax=Elysia marginata TaxID=1093978 RepID=A0AAV4JNZ2_9GAST|nr:hypothetical protein ElyMa_001621800 [Elysia marginata]